MTTETQIAKPADAVTRHWVERMPRGWLPYLQLMRLDRPIGTWLLYWPCVFGLVLGAITEERGFGGLHDAWYTFLFALGAVVMRGAGCTYNDIVDRDIDARVARTAGRPIPSGAVSVKRAWLFVAAQCLIGLAILLQFNRLAIELGVTSLLLIAIYPFMKRITWWPQAWLGITFNWGALLAFAAQTGTITLGDMVLYAALFFWTLGYDTIYAHQDKEDDALIGVKSTARLFGENSKKWILEFYVISFTLILTAGFIEHAGWPFGFLMLLAGAHMLRQVHTLKIDDPAHCLKLFRANRDTGALIALSLFVASWAG